MSLYTLEGRRVLRGSITLPRTGAWHADLVVDAQSPLAGAVTLSVADGAASFHGTVFRGDVFRETLHCRIVGGAGQLHRELPPKFYRGVPLRLPLADLLAEVGEKLAQSSDASVLDHLLLKWTRRRGPAAEALDELLDAAGARWRVLADGTVWIGRESWPELEFAHTLIKVDPADDALELASDLPLLRPGVVFGGKRISAVTHTFAPDRIRTEALVERSTLFDRMKAPLIALIRWVMREVDYFKPIAARVVQQDSDGTLHLQPDSANVPGLTGVPIRYGLPGTTARVPPGTRCLVEFEDGNPAAPIATSFEPGAVIELSFDGGSASVARVGDTVNAGTLSIIAAPPSPPGGPTLVTFTYAPPVGSPIAFTMQFAATAGVVMVPPTIAIPIVGRIVTGAPRVKA